MTKRFTIRFYCVICKQKCERTIKRVPGVDDFTLAQAALIERGWFMLDNKNIYCPVHTMELHAKLTEPDQPPIVNEETPAEQTETPQEVTQ